MDHFLQGRWRVVERSNKALGDQKNTHKQIFDARRSSSKRTHTSLTLKLRMKNRLIHLKSYNFYTNSLILKKIASNWMFHQLSLAKKEKRVEYCQEKITIIADGKIRV